MWITYPQTHILLKVSLSCASLKTTKQWSKWSSKAEVQRWDTFQEPTELRLIGCLTVKERSRNDFQWFFTDGEAKPIISTKARPLNLVLRNPWSARENPPQDLGHPVDRVNVDEGQGDHTSTRRLARTTQNLEVELSQVRRQEHAQNSDFWKQGDGEESSNSTCTGSESKNRVSEHEVHEPSVPDEGLPCFAREVGNYSKLPNILTRSIKNKCVDLVNVHVFVNESSHSSWTELFG